MPVVTLQNPTICLLYVTRRDRPSSRSREGASGLGRAPTEEGSGASNEGGEKTNGALASSVEKKHSDFPWWDRFPR